MCKFPVSGDLHIFVLRRLTIRSMKKKLSVLLVVVMVLMSFVGCAVPGAGASGSNAPFQAKDVSNYEFDLVNDAYTEDPLGNTMAAFNASTSEAVTEDDDVRFSNTYSYEEMAECFTLVTELNASNMSDYFALETVPDDEWYNKVLMNGTEGYYVSGAVAMNFKDKNGGDIQCTYDPLSEDGEINLCFKNDKSWTTESLNTVELQTSVSLYTFTPKEGMWTDYNGEQVICVYTNDGVTAVVELFENKPIELSYLLRVLSEKGLLSNETTPDAGGQDGTSTPVTTPDEGAAEQTPAPTPEPTYAYPFMGKYYVGTSAVYFDATYVYFDGNYNNPLTYTIDDLGNGNYFIDLGYGDGLTYIGANDMFFLSSQGFDAGDAYRSDKATFEAFAY